MDPSACELFLLLFVLVSSTNVEVPVPHPISAVAQVFSTWLCETNNVATQINEEKHESNRQQFAPENNDEGTAPALQNFERHGFTPGISRDGLPARRQRRVETGEVEYSRESHHF